MVTWDVWVPYSALEFLTTWDVIQSVEANSAKEAAYKWLEQFSSGEVAELDGATIRVRPRKNKRTALELAPEDRKSVAFDLMACTFVILDEKGKRNEDPGGTRKQ